MKYSRPILSFLFTSLFLVPSLLTVAQSDSLLLALYETHQDKILEVHENGYVYFEPYTIFEGEIADDYLPLLNLPASNHLVPIKSWVSPDLGYEHTKYQQYYDTIPIEGAELIEHINNDGYVYLVNGKITASEIGTELGTTPTLSEQDALDEALNFLDADTLAWEDPVWDSILQAKTGNPSATYYPQGRLVYAPDNYNMPTFYIPSEKFALCWKFKIRSLIPYKHVNIYVDAHSGAIYRRENLINSNSNADTQYYGNQDMDTEWHGGLFSHHYLLAQDGHHNFETKNQAQDQLGEPFTKLPKVRFGWNHGNWGDHDEEHTSAHWCTQQAWDYFAQVHQLEGMDGNSEKLNVRSDYVKPGAFYGRNDRLGESMLIIGQSDVGNNLNTLDVIGHEFTHGVDKRHNDLVYELEPGALDESFADIFGYNVERWSLGGHQNWTAGEDAGPAERNMKNPHAEKQPDTYVTDSLWVDLTGCIPVCDFDDPDYNDCCGVHTNSGVPNRWYTLMVDGGTHNGITVDGIPNNTARQIAFIALTDNMTRNSQFADARSATIDAARQKFGACSDEEVSCTDAWAAVGVGDPFHCNQVSIGEKRGQEIALSVYPIPAKEQINLELSVDQLFNWQVIDMRGMVMLDGTIDQTQSRYPIDITSLAEGVYTINVQLPENNIVRRFVKVQ